MSERTLISGNERRTEKPDPDWVRGQCPCCGAPIVSNAYYVAGCNGKGAMIIVWECWQSLGESPTCTFRRVL